MQNDLHNTNYNNILNQSFKKKINTKKSYQIKD